MVYPVYIMASASGVPYVGVKNDIEGRVIQHKQKEAPGFTHGYTTTKLVYFGPFMEVRDAVTREQQRKGWRREGKVVLIEKQSPYWLDLSEPFHR